MSQVIFTDARAFTVALDRIATAVPAALMSQIQRKLLIGALGGLIAKSPVDTGRFKCNWQVTQDAPAPGELPNLDPSGGATAATGKANIYGLAPYCRAFLSNNLPYGRVIEYGEYPPPAEGPRRPRAYKFVLRNGKRSRVNITAKTRAREFRTNQPKVTAQGFSTQAPQGVARLTFEEMKLAAAQLSNSGLRPVAPGGLGNG